MSRSWRERRIFVTGDTGFVGGWLAQSLLAAGARVDGYSLTDPAPMTVAAALGARHAYATRRADIRDVPALRRALRESDPEIVFHLAAQPLVRRAFRDPLATHAVNALGTANLLEAARDCPSLRAVVVFTTDKVYRNAERGGAFHERCELGSDEPYAASKVAAEMAVECWRARYFAPRGIGVASVRAGNLVGGGDWASDRIVPDAIRAFASGRVLDLRRPDAVRPWQHVLEVVDGALALSEALLEDPVRSAGAWNFGPPLCDCVTVGALVDRLAACWGPGARHRSHRVDAIPEAGLLRLDATKAARRLGWRTRWTIEETLQRTVGWYRAALSGADPAHLAAMDVDAHRPDMSARAA
jgi:CDP-glucose 4,6-dehydratase